MTASVTLLLVLALPFLSLRLAFTDAGTNPSSYPSRQAYPWVPADPGGARLAGSARSRARMS